MSRIGKEPVKVESGVTVTLDGPAVTVKGPKGELSWTLPAGISAEQKDGLVRFSRAADDRQSRANHGLARALVANMVEGNPKPYKIPAGITVKVENQGLHLDISGIDKQLVGRVAADIRAFKPAEPYKGKGIRYTGEKIRRKEGKTVA